MRTTHAILLLMTAAMAAPTSAAILVDGVVDAGYGDPVALQTVQTAFGDEDGLGDANGGELNAARLAIAGNRLFISITGNLETDSFNKLSLFIDSRAGGENVLSASPNYDFSDVSSNLGLVSFAPGFEPDFHLFARAGGGDFRVDLVDRLGGTSSDVLASTGSAALSGDFGVAIGQTDPATAPDGSGVIGEAVSLPVEFALDNSNDAGVGAFDIAAIDNAADASAAEAVATGAEFSIALSDLGVAPGGTISLVAAYSNGDYNFFSNQFLGGLGSDQGNLGADGFGNFIGDASGTALDLSGVAPFSITIPEPSSVALSLLVALSVSTATRKSRVGK